MRAAAAIDELLMKSGLELFSDKRDVREHCLLRGVGIALPNREINGFVLA
jgi:hypothetical protein